MPVLPVERTNYCPNCGFDLRGTASGICGECGTRVGRGIASLIPWRQRKWRGAFSAMWATMRLAAWRPSVLIRELAWRVPRGDPKVFARWSLVLMALVGTGMFAGAFGFHDGQWNGIPPAFSAFDPSDGTENFAMPAYALWDQWFILIPVALGLFAGGWVNQKLLAGLAILGAGNGRQRRRVWRMCGYFASISIWEMFWLGIVGMVVMIRLEMPAWSEKQQGALLAAEIVGGSLAALAVLGPSIDLLIRTSPRTASWKWRWWGLLAASLASVLLAMSVESDTLDWTPEWLLGIFELKLHELAGVTIGSLFLLTLAGLLATLALWKWRWAALRVVYFLVIYPAGHLAVLVLAMMASFWLCGWLSLAVASLVRG
jgi:hypothetical protein